MVAGWRKLWVQLTGRGCERCNVSLDLEGSGIGYSGWDTAGYFTCIILNNSKWRTWTWLSTQSRLCFIFYSIFLPFLPRNTYWNRNGLASVKCHCGRNGSVSISSLFVSSPVFCGGSQLQKHGTTAETPQCLLCCYCSMLSSCTERSCRFFN